MKNPISGILVLDKPLGISSREALDRISYLLPRVRIGHAGTLDPMATGVLVACLGKATRIIQYVQRMQKQYQATLRLGLRSETHDLEGSLLPNSQAEDPRHEINLPSIEQCLAKFRGDILQTPPQHSAVRVGGGRRAYELARSGQTIELQPRPVRVYQLNCRRFDYPEVDLEIECSSGTYVRSLARDIGDQLGCGAVLTRLVRTRIGVFRIEQANPPDKLSRQQVRELIRPLGDALAELPSVHVDLECLDDVRHGRCVAASVLDRVLPPNTECVMLTNSGDVLAVGRFDSSAQTIHPELVLSHD